MTYNEFITIRHEINNKIGVIQKEINDSIIYMGRDLDIIGKVIILGDNRYIIKNYSIELSEKTMSPNSTYVYENFFDLYYYIKSKFDVFVENEKNRIENVLLKLESFSRTEGLIK